MSESQGASVKSSDIRRFESLFKKIDINNDHKIELSELASALRLQIANSSSRHAKEIIDKGDKDNSGNLDFDEFVNYMVNHEEKLHQIFKEMDKNSDGQINPNEVKSALEKIDIVIDIDEANQLTKSIDKDGSISICWEEWRGFLQFCPNVELEDIVSYWRQSLMIDIGDSLTVPPEFTKKEKITGMWWRHLIAGGFAGAVSRTCTAPMDRLKIMLQVHGSTSNLGIISGFKQMLSEGGVKSLWRGNGTNVLKIAPESAMKFAAYEQLKKLLVGDGQIGIVERFAAGSMAGAFSQSMIYPLEVIKTRLAVGKTGQYKGILDCGVKVYQHEGLKALYRGYLPNIVGIIPYAGIDLSIYETLKTNYKRKNPEVKDPGILALLACGTISSTCGQLASYPLALVRTRLQAIGAADPNLTMFMLFKDILKTEGPTGLYRGILPNFLKVLPAVSVSYVIYEQAKKMLM